MNSSRFITTLSLAAAFALATRAPAQSDMSADMGRPGFAFSANSTASGEAKLKADGTSFRHVEISSFQLNASHGFRLDDSATLRIGLGYDFTDVYQGRYFHRLRRGEADVPLPEDFEALTASATYTEKLNDRWTLMTRVGAGSHVAGSGLLSEGWGANARIFALYNYSQTLTLGFGAAYDSLPEDMPFLGFFGFHWRPTPRWAVSLGFPRTGVSYHLNKSLSFALAASGARGTYHVEDDPAPGTAPRSLANSKLEQREIRLGFETQWRIDQTFAVSGAIGHVLYREFKYADRNYKLKSDDLVPFLSVGARISL